MNLKWLTPCLLVVAVGISVASLVLVPLTMGRFATLLSNVVGTVLVACAFEPCIPLHGDGGWWDSLKFAIKELPKYGSPPAFYVLRLYAGVGLLLVGALLSAVGAGQP